jgi:hypothetical protein
MLELPKPPTDNIYKFAALFGLTLFIASGASVAWNFRQRDASSWLVAMCIIAILGVALIVVGFWLWYTRAQVYEDRVLRAHAENDARRLEEEKGDQAKSVAIHKLQAELEVAAYKEIWEPLAILESSWDTLVRTEPVTDEILAELRKPVFGAREQLTTVIRRRRPFYEPAIYTELEFLLHQMEVSLSKVVYLRANTGSADRRKFWEDFVKLRGSIDRASNSMRGRLASMKLI